MIGIRSKAAALAEKAWAMTDAPISVIIRRPGTSIYNPATGKKTTTAATDYPVDAIVKTYDQNEIDGSKVLTTDRKAIVRQAQCSEAGAIKTSDNFVVDGVVKTIADVGQDAIGVTWVLQVR